MMPANCTPSARQLIAALMLATLAILPADAQTAAETVNPAVYATSGDLPANPLLADALGTPVTRFAGIDPVISPTLQGLPDIPSNFDIAPFMQRNAQPPADAGNVDPLGAFRLICQAGHLSYDDPIVYPGVPGGSPHLHQFFGNSLANANATFRTLRTSGDSSCMGPLNRSAYWMPAMMNPAGQVVRPDWLSVYYKRLPASNPECTRAAKACLRLPRGLRYIFGYDMNRMGRAQPENLRFTWKCLSPADATLAQSTSGFAQFACPAGNKLMVTIAAPDCWDGVRLDSPDHRSHVVYQRRDPHTGQPACPATHRYIIPQFTMGASWEVAEGEDSRQWHLASDRMPGMANMAAGSSFHADWYGAWDDGALQRWTDQCINGHLSCVDGTLGNELAMRRPSGFGYRASPRLVSPPAR